MSTNSIAGTAATTNQATVWRTGASSYSRAANDRSSNPGSDSVQAGGTGGGTLFSALLAALTQFVLDNPASAGTTAAGTTAPSTAAATSSAAAASSSATTSSSGTSSSSLSADLQTFLHDLSQALRQAGGSRHGHHHDGSRAEPAESDSTPTAPTAASTPTNAATGAGTAIPTTAATGAGAGAAATAASTATTSASAPTAVTTPTTTAGTTPVTTPVTTAAATAGAGFSSRGIAHYGQHSVISELKTLISDLSNGQGAGTAAAASATSNSSSTALSNLATAFSKLISDLGGAQSPTAALQSFLSSFLQDLQNGGGSSNTRGNAVNVSA
jgi:hypothetical protein